MLKFLVIAYFLLSPYVCSDSGDTCLILLGSVSSGRVTTAARSVLKPYVLFIIINL